MSQELKTPIQGETKTVRVHKSKTIPFSIIEVTEIKDEKENVNFQITIGNNIVSEKKFSERKHAETYIGTKPWELIINVASLLVNYTEQ